MNMTLKFLLFFFCICAGKPVTIDQSWDFLHLAQFWPATSCYVHFGKDCSGIPKGVTGWTIHGLWPSRRGSERPQYCNSTLKFDYDQIKGLSPMLESRWPSYYTSQPTSLWKHEWEKHGTCAMSLPALRGEPNYFALTMWLQQPLDLFRNLARSRIFPSATTMYKPADIYWAVRQGVGVDPNIVCSYDNQTKRHYIEQVWICFTKEFLLQDCPYVADSTVNSSSSKKLGNNPSRFSQCPDIGTASVYYLPLTPPSPDVGENKKSTLKISPEKSGKRLQNQPYEIFKLKEQKEHKNQSNSVFYFRSEVEAILRSN